MTDKERIRKEVERLQNELIQEKKKGFGSETDDACILELQNVLTYIDSLQEEPVSEDLEEAATKSANKATPYTRVDIGNGEVCVYTKHTVIDRFKVGAKWQRMQIDKDVNNLINVICNSCTPNAFGTLEQCIAAAQIEALKLIKED